MCVKNLLQPHLQTPLKYLDDRPGRKTTRHRPGRTIQAEKRHVIAKASVSAKTATGQDGGQANREGVDVGAQQMATLKS